MYDDEGPAWLVDRAADGRVGFVLHAQAPPAKNPLLKLAQPWPDADQLRQRKAEAEALRLFSADDPIVFTLTGDFRAINRDRDPNSRRLYPAKLTIAADGRTSEIAIGLNPRGHVRRMARTCDFVPLRMTLSKNEADDTVFRGQDALKLVVQCRGGAAFEQDPLKEYLAYRIFNTLSPRGVRARLAKVSYLDVDGKSAGARYGILLEDDSDVARRLEGRIVELPRTLFSDMEPDALATMMVFAYMIGSTDFSIYALHNVILVQTPDRVLHPVPYDFDMTGLVSPPYAIPDRRLPIASVKERLYRGPCRTPEQIQPILAHFNAERDRVLSLPESIADLTSPSRQEVRGYLEGFYSSIGDPAKVKRPFVEGCSKAPGM